MLRRSDEAEEIRTRMRGAFSTIYLTLLSIIQGVALAVLFAKVDSLIDGHEFHAPQVVMATGIFLAIVAVWNQYQMGVMLYAWTAEIFDAFIPFGLGLTEYAMISAIDRGASAVLFANGALLVMGIAAFEYQYFQVRRNAGAGAFVHELNHDFRAMDAISTAIAAALAFAAALLLARAGPGSPGELAGAWLVVAIAVGHFAREVLQWRTVQRRLAGEA